MDKKKTPLDAMNSAPAPITAEGGLPAELTGEHDPLAALDDLMAVVEAFAPVPPARPLFSDRDVFLL